MSRMSSPMIYAIITLLIGVAGSVQAQVFTDTTTPSPATSLGFAFGTSEVDYDVDGPDPDIDRKWLGVTVNSGLSEGFALIGQGAFIFDTEWDSGTDLDDGKGFMLGAGILADVHTLPLPDSRTLVFSAYGLINYTSEDFEDEVSGIDLKIDMSILDFHAGGMVMYSLSDAFKPYSGAELVLHSDGEIDYEFGSAKGDEDIDRDDTLSFRLGARIPLTSVVLRPELVIAGEQSLILHVSLH